MNINNPRVTMIMGAGAVLDMNFPSNIIKPTTWNITEKVRKPYDDIFCANREITIVEDIYQILVRSFPADHNIWWATNYIPNIHFEILFHVMEQLIAYQSVWASNNHNPYTFPHFAPFTAMNFSFDPKDLNQVMWKFIMRIMEIVNAYNEYFRNDNGAENWYRDFFKSDFKWDVFNFNYDTTVEQSLGMYEDGFEQMTNRIDSMLVSHQFYLPVGKKVEEIERMDSEIRTVGNIDEVSADVLEIFDYAALGHIHKPMKLGNENWRYCGTPLACSVSEAQQQKGIIMIEMGVKGEVETTVLPLYPLHQVRVIKGELEEILAEKSQDSNTEWNEAT